MNRPISIRARWGALAALALCAGLFLAGCSAGPEPESPTPGGASEAAEAADPNLSRLIDEGLQQAGSVFQREILQKVRDTGELSEADWKEANNRYVQCMRDAGYDVETMYNGAQVQFVFAAEPGTHDTEEQRAESQEADSVCMMQTNAFINEIYTYLDEGGEGSEGHEMERAILACLIDRGLAPEDTTLEQFMADLDTGSSEFAPGSSEEHAACWVENS